jgi:undecaprenol kinase
MGGAVSGTFVQSFGFAFRGLADAWREERNFRVQCGYAVLTLILGLWLRPPVPLALLVGLAMTLLLAAELMNSALERAIDLSVTEFHPLARSAKDLAASSVLLVAIGTAVINLWVLGGLMLTPGACLGYGLSLLLVLLRRFAPGGVR